MPVFVLILMAIAIMVLLPLSRKGHTHARIAVAVLSVLVVIGAVQRMFFSPTQGERRIQSYVDYNGLSGAYAGRYIAQTYPGETVAVIVQSISPQAIEIGMVDKAILKGLRDEIRQGGGSIQTVTTQRQPLTAESIDLMLDEGGPKLEIADLPQEAEGAGVIVSLVGNPGGGLVRAVSGERKDPAVFVFQDTYPPRLAGAIRNGSIEAMVSLRPNVNPDMVFRKRAPMEEQFNRRFIWVTADNVEILQSF